MEETHVVLQKIPVDKIVVNGLNPREDMGDLTGLRQSIVNLFNKTGDGLIQPLRVRQYKGNGKMELIAGERRYTAITEAIKSGELPKDYQPQCLVENVDDETAMQMMFIENLLRKDLTDYEQAVSFKDYLAKFEDPKAIDELAEKTGINIHYIRRRAKILDLPEGVLKLWQDGKLLFGHLEQLLRVGNENAENIAKSIIQRALSVNYLKQWIEREATTFNNAIFDLKVVGCESCLCSTKTQKGLFGDDDFKTKKPMCTKSECFYQNQLAALPVNWKKHPEVKKQKTNGYILAKEGVDYLNIYQPKKKCLECEHLVTAFSEEGMTGHYPVCKGAKSCAAKIYGSKSSETAPNKKSSEENSKTKAENLAYDTAERFYFENLPAIIMKKDAGVETARVQLLALVINNSSIWATVMQNRGVKAEKYSVSDSFIESIFEMKLAEVNGYIREISAQMILSQRHFRLKTRRQVAQMLGLHIDTAFVMNKSYLGRKSKDDLIAMNKKYKILDLDKMTLEQYKRSAIVEKFLKAKLKGIVPDEIAVVAKGKYDKVYRTTKMDEEKAKA